MTNIVDRRSQKNKSAPNRKKFIDRYKDEIKRAVQKSVNDKKLGDMENSSEDVVIDISSGELPIIQKDFNTGTPKRVFTGNKQFAKGDTIPRPYDGRGSSGSTDDPDTLRSFAFTLTKEEFLDIYFSDLALPDFIKKTVINGDKPEYKRAGYKNDGIPPQLDLKKSMKQALARKLSAKAAREKQIEQLMDEIEALSAQEDKHEQLSILHNQANVLASKHDIYLDDIDLKYKQYLPQPKPDCKALVFFLMDVSGSMGEEMIALAKRFFFLMLLFLKQNYKHVETVFVRYTTTAKICDEEEFFHGKETGGTVMVDALKVTLEEIKNKYNSDEWNIYIAHACDSETMNDAYTSTINEIHDLVVRNLFNYIQYYAYLHVWNPGFGDDLKEHLIEARPLYTKFQKWAAVHPKLGFADTNSPNGCYEALRKLFAKELNNEVFF